MALTVVKRCNRCRKPMRNDGTDTEPKWVCDNQNCVKYVPPAPVEEDEPDTENNE